MKTIKNIFSVLLAMVAITAFYSCGEDEPEYTPADKLNSEEVYFPSTNSSSIELSSVANSFDIPIARVKTDDAVTVPLTVTGGEGVYTVPTSVTFAQGASTATITVTYDPDVVGFDTYTEIRLSIGDESYSTLYGLSEYAVTVGIPAPWASLGNCTFIEDFVSTFWAVDNIPYSVELQENQLTPGYFRLVNPFGAAYPYNATGDWDDSKDWYLEIHAEDPTAVYMYVQETGMDWGYGMISMGGLSGYYMAKGQTLEQVKASGYTGTYENGIITFPAKTLLIGMSDYNSGALYLANNNGAFKVVMPGVVLADYSIEVAYAGKYMGTDNQVAGVLAQIASVGEDVESVRLAVVEGTDVDAAAEGIKSGEIESVEVAPSATTVLLPFASEPVAGRYTIVAVTYGDGEAQEVSSAEFKYTPLNSETWTARYVGDYVYTLFFGSDDEPATDSGLVLYQSDSDPNRWKIEHWGYDVDFIFTFNQTTGEIIVEDQEVGYVHSSYGTVYVDDLVDYTGGTKYGYSYYADGVFHFAVVYYVSAGEFNYGTETFTLTGNATSAAAKSKALSPFQTVKKSFKTDSDLSHPKFLRKSINGKVFR